MRHHGILNRVGGAIWCGQPFDGDHRLTFKLGQKQDTGVQCVRPVRVAYHYCTSAAVAFIASLFCAGQATLFAQPIQQRFHRRAVHCHSLSVQKKRRFHEDVSAAVPIAIQTSRSMRRRTRGGPYTMLIKPHHSWQGACNFCNAALTIIGIVQAQHWHKCEFRSHSQPLYLLE